MHTATMPTSHGLRDEHSTVEASSQHPSSEAVMQFAGSVVAQVRPPASIATTSPRLFFELCEYSSASRAGLPPPPVVACLVASVVWRRVRDQVTPCCSPFLSPQTTNNKGARTMLDLFQLCCASGEHHVCIITGGSSFLLKNF